MAMLSSWFVLLNSMHNYGLPILEVGVLNYRSVSERAPVRFRFSAILKASGDEGWD